LSSSLLHRIRVGTAAAAAAATVCAVVAGTLPASAAETGVTPAAAPGHETVTTDIQGTLDDGTRTKSFNDGWKFSLVNAAATTDPTGAYANAMAPGYDDSSWRQLSLPHDWSIELNPTTTGTTSGTGYLQGGLGWYRKTFTLPASDAGKKISVEFDGVYMDSYIYVNGQQVANHPYGYTGFNVDLTPYVKTDGTPNVIAVKVQNKLPTSRWYSGSGIYRNTHLVVTDPVHVARQGVFVTTPNVSRQSADVHTRTSVVGDGRVVSTVRDPRGRVVGRAAGAESDIRLTRPLLWSTDEVQSNTKSKGKEKKLKIEIDIEEERCRKKTILKKIK